MIRRGRREREAGKRHRRGRVIFWDGAAAAGRTLKLGSKKMRSHLSVVSLSRIPKSQTVAELESGQ